MCSKIGAQIRGLWCGGVTPSPKKFKYCLKLGPKIIVELQKVSDETIVSLTFFLKCSKFTKIRPLLDFKLDSRI